MSETIAQQKVWGALARVQGKLHNAKLDSKNPHFKSEYASLESYIDQARPLLAEEELSLMQGCTKQGEDWVLETRVTHADGSHVSFVVPLLISKQDMQGLGSAITYARRYGIGAILNMGSSDDDGNEAVTQTKGPEAKAEPARTFKNFAPRGPAPTQELKAQTMPKHEDQTQVRLGSPKLAAEHARNVLKWTSVDFQKVWDAYGIKNYAGLRDYKEQREFIDAIQAGASADEIVRQKMGNVPSFDSDEKLPF